MAHGSWLTDWLTQTSSSLATLEKRIFTLNVADCNSGQQTADSRQQTADSDDDHGKPSKFYLLAVLMRAKPPSNCGIEIDVYIMRIRCSCFVKNFVNEVE
jgi:hypothetical protein